MAEEFTFDNVRRPVTGIAWGKTSSPACFAAKWLKSGKSLGQQLKELFAKVGSSGPNRQNFRLTLEVKAKFTEKLRVDQQ
jgi:hypothetical protein